MDLSSSGLIKSTGWIGLKPLVCSGLSHRRDWRRSELIKPSSLIPYTLLTLCCLSSRLRLAGPGDLGSKNKFHRVTTGGESEFVVEIKDSYGLRVKNLIRRTTVVYH